LRAKSHQVQYRLRISHAGTFVSGKDRTAFPTKSMSWARASGSAISEIILEEMLSIRCWLIKLSSCDVPGHFHIAIGLRKRREGV
jgi:hypothetical protein